MIAGDDPLAASLAALSARGRSWLSSLQYCDLRNYLPLDILVKVDRMTMAHSIEARPALLDHRVVECAASIPAAMKLRGVTTKYLFKRALRGLVPDEIIDRPKQGFAAPLAEWFRGPWLSFARDILLSERCRSRGVFNRTHIEHVLDLNREGRNMDQQIWTMVSFEQWCRLFLDGARVPAPAVASVSRRPVAVPACGL
jgi:asparagine synthase (glutamine-hydrolysing)